MPRKVLTRAQAETAKKRAALFLRNVVRDDERADEVESESVEEWATETGRTITNPKRKEDRRMATSKTKQDLQDELDDANDYIEQLEAKLGDIAGIVSDEDENEEEAEDDDEDNDLED